MTTKQTKRMRPPEIQALLRKTDAERLQFIRSNHWIGYPVANGLLRRMAALVEQPDVIRPPNMLIISHTNNGKSTLARQFEKRFPAQDDPATGGIERPVVVLEVPPAHDEDRLYKHILNELGAVGRDRAPKDTIHRLLRDLKMRVLVLDEVNNALAGNAIQRQQMLNAIKGLSNELKRPIVLTGTEDALAALRDDKQLQNRFPPSFIPPWQLNHDFLRLLVSFESILPLKRRTDMANENLAALLMAMSDGYIGELRDLLVLAGVTAIETGAECINRKLLLSLDWVPPSLRDQQATAAELGQSYHVNYSERLRELSERIADETEDLSDEPLEEENWEDEGVSGDGDEA